MNQGKHLLSQVILGLIMFTVCLDTLSRRLLPALPSLVVVAVVVAVLRLVFFHTRRW